MAIVWGNKGSATSNTDGFNTQYGSNAALARTIVDRAVADWNSVITNFNYGPGVGMPTNFDLDVSATTLNTGERGATAVTNSWGNTTTGYTPFEATVQLDNDGAGAGWYFDTSAGDDGEFDQNTFAFEAAFGQHGADFYRTITHEIGHAVGITLTNPDLKIWKQSTAAGTDAIDGTSQLRTVPGGGGTTVTLTMNGNGHIYENAHPHDLLNPGRTITGNNTVRQLISDLDAKLLQQVYGYSIVLPSQLNSMLSNLTSANNKVTITGTSSANNVVIDYTSSGRVRTSITSGGVTYVESFPASSVTQVNAFTGNGNDTITASAFNKKVFIDGGADSDSLTGGTAGDTIVGGNGADILYATGNNDGDDNFYASPSTTSSVNGFIDTLDFTSKSAGVDADFSGYGLAQKPAGTRNVVEIDGGSNDLVMGFRVFRFGSGNDVFDNRIYVGPGTGDSYGIDGGASVYGGAGNDTLFSNVYESDFFDGGSGTDAGYGQPDDNFVSTEN